MALQPQGWLSPEAYLAIERQSACKSEYVAGEMFAMAGASRRNNLIVANVIRILGNQLLASPCNVYPSDMRLKIPRTGRYTYPDVVVACAEEQFEDEHRDTLLNPVGACSHFSGQASSKARCEVAICFNRFHRPAL